MSKQWVRQELKKNEVALATERAAAWIMNHREAAFGIGLTLLIAFFLGIYSVIRYSELKTTAWERLAVAESYAFAGQSKPALDQLKNIAEQFPRTRAAGFSQLFQADVLYQSGMYKEAIEAYQQTLDRQDVNLSPFALSGIAFSQEASGQYQASMDTAQRFLATYQDHYLAPQVHAILAQALKSLGREEEAKATLEKIALLYPDTFWSQWAQTNLHPPEKTSSIPKPPTEAKKGGKPTETKETSPGTASQKPVTPSPAPTAQAGPQPAPATPAAPASSGPKAAAPDSNKKQP
jgi:tetratricopeptide (TPR) repeat protein